MKTSVILNLVLAIAVVVLGYKLVASNNGGNAGNAVSAENTAKQEGELKPFDVTESLDTHPFKFFTGDGLLLAAGDSTSSNAMTIGWGGLGTLWGKPTVTVYVREGRHTHEFMERSKYFTVMTFSDKSVLRYMGTHSGRDGDKAKALGLHTLYTANGTPYYAEADTVIECRTMWAGNLDKAGFRSDVPANFYEEHDDGNGLHTEYIGEVVSALHR
jgi:hypothetical protein